MKVEALPKDEALAKVEALAGGEMLPAANPCTLGICKGTSSGFWGFGVWGLVFGVWCLVFGGWWLGFDDWSLWFMLHRFLLIVYCTYSMV